jgi:phosphoenolpyruvate synthase/pyruvate phosphate dikinase
MRVAWLGEPASFDESVVGGKTANLGRLAATFQVPPGFCIDASAHDRLGAAARSDAIARGELHELVATSYADLGRRMRHPGPRVAVRSSAIGEDSRDASFAGQYETVLNVEGAHAIVDAVLHCWRSLSSERALAYRRARGIAETPRVAVLVQAMVDAELSAIAFSADPVSGEREVIVVNAARGLGDAIASGTITPDTFRLRKSDLAIVERRSASAEPIADEDVVAVGRLTAQLERAMGWPVDIECARQADGLYLLQCRPITTLRDEFPIVWPRPGDDALLWTQEDTHFDQALGPLAIDFVRNAVDYTIQKRLRDTGSPVRVRHEAFNGRFYVSSVRVAPPDDFPAALAAATARRRAGARTLRQRWDDEMLQEIRGHYEWIRTLDIATLPAAAAAEAWAELWRRVRRIWVLHFTITGSAYPVMEELAEAYGAATGETGTAAFAIVAGLAPTLQQLEADLEALVETARTSGTASAEFARALASFLARHGDVGQETLDIASPAWRDDPARLIALVAERARAAPVETAADRQARLRARAEELVERARGRLSDRPAERDRFDEVVAAACAAGPLTEEHNYWIDRVSQAVVRRAALAFGQRLVGDGSIAAPEDVFLLYAAEIEAALREPSDQRALVESHADELRRWKRLRAPKTIGAPAVPPPGAEKTGPEALAEPMGIDMLKGAAASVGVARGPARLVRDEGDFTKMRAGDVLVCHASTVSWIPLFTMASAVVTEIGGILEHAAVVAREFGVPAVVGVESALTTLSDGEPLEVDGATGRVRRLFPVSWSDPEDVKLLWRRDDAHNTGVIRPLAIEYIRHGATYGMRRRDDELGPPVVQRIEAFNGRSYTSTRWLRPAEEMATHLRAAQQRRRELARRIRRDWDERYLPELDEHYRWMRALSISDVSAQAAADAWDDLWRRHRRAWRIHMLVTAGSYAIMDELSETWVELLGDEPAEALALTQGLAQTLQRLERDLQELTESARRSPAVAAAMARGARVAELRALDARFGDAIDVFLGAHGDAGETGEGFGARSWQDDPDLLLQAIARRVAAPVEQPDERLRRLRARAADLEREARRRLAGRPGALARFEEVLATARAAGPLTEEHNYWLDRRNMTNVARAVRAFGSRLVHDGALRDREEIFLLYVAEVRQALRHPADLSALIAERTEEQIRWRTFVAPETIGAADAAQQRSGTGTIAMRHLLYRAEQDDPTRVLRGAAASAGVARGPARLIRELDEFPRFQRGDVLVCQSSNVSWIPLFTSASAVVTDVGGALSHAAVVAREFGIPAVVGTSVALATLRDGEPLEVDGSRGLVRRLSA